MKSFSSDSRPETAGLEFARLGTPTGKYFHHAPAVGELFTIDDEVPEPINGSPWYPRGTYVFTGLEWLRLSDSGRKRRSAPIGSQNFEIDRPGTTKNIPRKGDGQLLASITTGASTKRARFSGSASCWVDLSVSGHIWLSVFQNTKLVAVAAEYIEAGKPRTVSISFLDNPGSTEKLLFTLRINTDVAGFLFVNQCDKFLFDGVSQTAFIVAEDN